MHGDQDDLLDESDEDDAPSGRTQPERTVTKGSRVLFLFRFPGYRLLAKGGPDLADTPDLIPVMSSRERKAIASQRHQIRTRKFRVPNHAPSRPGFKKCDPEANFALGSRTRNFRVPPNFENGHETRNTKISCSTIWERTGEVRDEMRLDEMRLD